MSCKSYARRQEFRQSPIQHICQYDWRVQSYDQNRRALWLFLILRGRHCSTQMARACGEGTPIQMPAHPRDPGNDAKAKAPIEGFDDVRLQKFRRRDSACKSIQPLNGGFIRIYRACCQRCLSHATSKAPILNSPFQSHGSWKTPYICNLDEVFGTLQQRHVTWQSKPRVSGRGSRLLPRFRMRSKIAPPANHSA